MNSPSQLAASAALRRARGLGSKAAPSIGRPLTPAYERVAPPKPSPSPASVTVRQVQMEQPRAGSIYQQLMRKHDRMTERHLPKT
ncbi:MAG: hypothetical protein GX558_11935 [Clostridiales bacterium]|nr:hypothetical protein [Clostridiales bacterium]